MKRKAKKEFGEATRASANKEMAKPRMAKSACEGEIDLTVARIAPGKLCKHKLQLLPLLQRLTSPEAVLFFKAHSSTMECWN
jgi:hypothetical protein